MTEVFEGTTPSKIIFPPPQLKTNGTSLLILFFVKDFKEKEVEFLTEQILQKYANKWATVLHINMFFSDLTFILAISILFKGMPNSF